MKYGTPIKNSIAVFTVRGCRGRFRCHKEKFRWGTTPLFLQCWRKTTSHSIRKKQHCRGPRGKNLFSRNNPANCMTQHNRDIIQSVVVISRMGEIRMTQRFRVCSVRKFTVKIIFQKANSWIGNMSALFPHKQMACFESISFQKQNK